jgi:hypothetical protein
LTVGAPLAAANGLSAQYFPNESLTAAGIERTDAMVGFTWGAGGPGSPIPVDHFSARWMGYLQAPTTEQLTLIARTDDGVRVWLDDVLVINSWITRSAADSIYVFPAVAGQKYQIKVEYYERTGSATAILAWQTPTIARQNIPTSALFPMPGFVVGLPASSATSPVFVEGPFSPVRIPTIVAGGSQLVVSTTNDTHFYGNIPLSDKMTDVVVSSGSQVQVGSIAWAPTIITDTLNLDIRAGDSLRLQSPVAGQLRFTQNCGVDRPAIPVSANTSVQVAFPNPGYYLVYAENMSGTTIAVGAITVVGADLRGPIACEVGFTRGKTIGVSDPALVTLATSHPEVVSVSSDTAGSTGERRLGLTCTGSGRASLVARLNGATGPIISAVPLNIFALDVKGRSGITVNAATSSGTDRLTMRPYVPGISYTLTMNAHHATFAGGAWTLSLASNSFTIVTDPETNEVYGYKDYDIELPQNEDTFCYRLRVFQQTDDLESLNDQQINGTDCRLEVTQIFFLKGTVVVKPMPIKCIKKGSRHHPHPVKIPPKGAASPTVDSGSPIDCPGDNMMINPPVQVRNTAAVPVGKYDADIDGTKFPEVVIVWDMELHTRDHALVVPNQVLLINGVPEMPIMRSNLIPDLLPGAADWTCTFAYARFTQDPAPDVYHPNGNPVSATATWIINATMGTQFRGGNVELRVVYQGDTKTLPYRVLGENPARADAEAFLTAQNPPPYASAIITHESNWRQFNQGTNNFNQEPNFGAPNGWGIGQLDPPPGKQHLWHWRDNMTEAAVRMRAYQAEANAWVTSQVTEQQAENPNRPLANESFVFGGVTYRSGTSRTPEHACGIGRYNGATPWPVAWDRPAQPGAWSGQDNANGYVGIISAIWGQGQ